METYILVDCWTINGVLDQCTASCKKSAIHTFTLRGWNIGDVLSEADYIAEQQQNAMELQ